MIEKIENRLKKKKKKKHKPEINRDGENKLEVRERLGKTI